MHKFTAQLKTMLWLLTFAVATMLSAIAPAHADTGGDWLAAQFQADGSVATGPGIATAYQSTAEALRWWAESGENKSLVPAAVDYLEAENYGGTEYLARLILARDESGLNVVNQIDELKVRANQDGGFGELAGYGSTALDTAFALQALKSTGYGNIPAATSSVNFLLNAQKSDGGWAMGTNDNSVYVTALAVVALSPYKSTYTQVPAALNAARNFLLSKRDGTGLWGEDHISASVLIALLTDGAEASLFKSSAEALINKQVTNGSWSDDVYTTALALRALAAYNAANSGVSGTQTGTVEGTVVKANSHEPIANAEIALTSVSGFTVMSDSAGYFKMAGVPVGTQTLVARKNGYNSLSRVVTVVSGQLSDAGTLGLSSDPQTGAVVGHIEDGQDHLALAGTLITLAGAETRSTVTDSNGNFEWSSLPPGDYTIHIEKTGYNPINGTLTVVGGSSVTLRQALIKVGVYLDADPGNLFGKVVDGESGEALSGAQVAMANGSTVATGSDGSFVFNALARGAYQAQLTADGYQGQAISFVFSPGSNGDLGTLRLYRLGGSVVPSSIALSGRVVDGVGGAVIPNATVKWVETGETVQTTADGTFAISGIDSLNFTLVITASGFTGRTYTINASGFGEFFQEFALPPTTTEPAATTSVLGGVVKNNATGLPVTGAKVALADGRGLAVTTGSDGKYEFTGIATLSFAVNVSAEGYYAAARQVTLSAHGRYTADLTVEPLPQAQAEAQHFQIVTLNPPNAAAGANETMLFTAEIANLLGEAQEATVLGEIVDAEGTSIATVSPYAPGTTEPTSQFGFTPKENKVLTVPWDTAQTEPGTYRLILRTIKPGTINRSLPFGQVLAENQAFGQIVATRSFGGALGLDPPLTQAGSKTPVKLEIFLGNTGNVGLDSLPLTLTVKQPGTGTVLHQATATAGQLAVNGYQYLSFGNWIPTAEGNLPITIKASNGVVGEITGNLYVGDKAAGTFSIDKTIVPEGNQTAHGKITLEGVDTASGKATDPLFVAVQNAVKTGSAYTANGAMTWQKSERCLGCHIQTQSLVGVASAFQKNLGDEASAVNLYNTVASSQQNDGGLRTSYPEHTKTQTMLGAWSLNTWNGEESFRTLYRASQHLYARRSQSGNQTWLASDHVSGWWYSNESQTAMTVKAYAHLLKTAQTADLGKIKDYRLDSKGLLGAGTLPRDVELAKDGYLYTVKTTGEITRFNTVTNTAEPVAKLAIDGYGIAVADDGTIYVSGNGGKLLRRNPSGTVDTLRTGSGYLTDVEIGPDGLVYVVDYSNHRLLRRNGNGQFETWVTGGVLNLPYGMTFDKNGNALIANSLGYNIVKVDPAKKVSIFADGLAYRPLYIDHRPDGGFYYSSYEYSSHGQYTPFAINSLNSRGVVERLNSSSTRIMGIAVKPDGQVFMANEGDNKIYQLSSFALDTTQLANFATETTRASNYFLARHKDGTTDNIIQAMRLTGLAEARKVIVDAALKTQVDTAITAIATTLRARQRTDGGWGKTTGHGSDAMVTALVGLALDYTNPFADDPVVRKTIQYLLNTQQADRSWVSNNGVLSTRLASTSLVVAYLPVALERLGGIDVDLHVKFPASVLLNNPVPAPTSQVANANGGIDYYWKLLGVTANKRSLDFDLTLKNMALKEQRAVADAAYIEFENSFTTEKLRVDLDIPTVKAASGLALALTTDRTSYTAHDTVLVRPVVTNTGPTIAGGSAKVYIRAAGSTENLATLTPLPVPNLAVSANLALETPWDTGATLTGNYEAYVRLLDAQGRVVDEATAPFQIAAGVTALIDGRVVTDKPFYAAWDTVNIDARVQNITKNAIQAPTRVEMTVTTPDGRMILNETANIGELVPNALRDLQFALNLADAVTGDYPVQMTVKDAVSRETLITRATVFHVERLAIQALSGNVAATPVQVNQGEPVNCLETVLNKSASPITGAVLTSKLVSAQTQDVLNLQTRNADFAANATLTETRPIATGNLAVGTYACILMADLGGQSLQLGAALFDVLEPPIKINGSFEPGKQGRVLVLLDPGTDNDPLGPNHVPTMGVQRPYLEQLLTDAGWSYTIATHADTFTRELRSGGYVTYLLLSESVKLPETVQQEVREAVNRGEGLVEAGGHDQRQGRIDEALGLKFTGKHPRMTGIAVNAGTFTAQGQLPLQLNDKTLRFQLDGASSLGQFINNGTETGDLALAERQYGLGRTVHVGYDLLAEAAMPGADSRHGQLLLDALSRVHPEPLVPYAHSVYPLTVKLANVGIATPGRVVVKLPSNVTVVDAGGATNTDGQWVWAFDLAKNASVDYTLWVRLPDAPVTVNATVESGSAGSYKIQQELTLSIETLTANDLQAALDGIAPMTANSYKQAQTALEQAQTQSLAGNWSASLDALRTAADRLITVGTAEASIIRLDTDRALRSVAIKTVAP